jgi:alkanesulfonate monooxygenase SsuD/methylene tetrahydromethanopterin reductase-like flavin-dependent oxidoreductase (luciferase family)
MRAAAPSDTKELNMSQINPVLDENRLKLATFATNVTGGNTMTAVPERLEIDWETTVDLAREADDAGFEAIIPVARWMGFGGATNPQGASYETYTWAAAIAQATRRATIFATSHVTITHPIVAAKQIATIDHVSGGRCGLNIVCGWFAAENEMFGAEQLEHDARYDYASEWFEVVSRLWSTEEPFDFPGEFFNLPGLVSEPKPIQSPRPPIMNAGFSPVGQRWAARNADMAFTVPSERSFEGARKAIGGIKKIANEEFEREIAVWIPCYVVCRPTEQEAQAYLEHYAVTNADTDALARLTALTLPALDNAAPGERDNMLRHVAAGLSGYPLVGTPEQIADTLQGLAAAGADGCTLNWVDYPTELRSWNAEVMPLLERAGLRAPFHSGEPAPVG